MITTRLRYLWNLAQTCWGYPDRDIVRLLHDSVIGIARGINYLVKYIDKLQN
jgi:hypothetical protein